MKLATFVFSIALIATPTMAADLQAAADDVCSCLEAPHKVMQKAINDLTQAQAGGDHASMALAQGEMMGVMNATDTCFSELPAKYPQIDKDKALQDKVMALVNKKCPNPASAFMR